MKPDIGSSPFNCETELIHSGKNYTEQANLLFSPSSNEPCRSLNSGKKVNVTYVVRPRIINDISQESSCAARLGAVHIEWSPVPLKNTEDVAMNTEPQFQGYHGPLPVKQARLLKQKGPLCHIEMTPFDASIQVIPPMPKVGRPFEVRYQIVNRTSLHQRLRVLMNDSESIASSNNILISGIINGEMILGPFEKKILSYNVLVTKVGNTATPSFDVSSVRYNSWVVHGSKKIFVSP